MTMFETRAEAAYYRTEHVATVASIRSVAASVFGRFKSEIVDSISLFGRFISLFGRVGDLPWSVS
jgi:hypothetical protein